MTHDREPTYGLQFEEARELALSEAGWTYEWNDDLQTGGWRDPLPDDDEDVPTLYSAQAALKLMIRRKRPLRDIVRDYTNILE